MALESLWVKGAEPQTNRRHAGKDPSTMVESPATAPLTSQLGPAVPNPFNCRTFFTFELTKSAPTQVVIYNLRGEKIQVLLDDHPEPGHYSLS